MPANFPVGGRDAIRAAFRAEYDRLEGSGGYRALGASWGVSPGVAHSMCNKRNYWPSDPVIEAAILSAAADRGIRINRRGRKRDLWSLDPRILLWMIQNREDVIPGPGRQE